MCDFRPPSQLILVSVEIYQTVFEFTLCRGLNAKEFRRLRTATKDAVFGICVNILLLLSFAVTAVSGILKDPLKKTNKNVI